jgi:uncharacterized membrane protein YgaE (UPF0421/DUF939 family)
MTCLQENLDLQEIQELQETRELKETQETQETQDTQETQEVAELLFLHLVCVDVMPPLSISAKLLHLIHLQLSSPFRDVFASVFLIK